MRRTTDIYFPKSAIEKSFIKSIWRLSESDFQNRKEIILPKGTVEIIFNFSEKINYYNPSFQTSTLLPLVFVNGINFKPFELTKSGRQVFLGIQLNSIGLRLLFNISVKEFNNKVYNVADICPQLANLAEALFHENVFNKQVQIILSWIRRKSPSNCFQYSLNRIQKLMSFGDYHNLTVKKLSREICLSDRQLRRLSMDWLGMNTEEFILYQKYLNGLHLLHNSKQNLTEIGMEAGYYDQSHFIREFKSYTGMTPKQYRKSNAEFPGHIFV